MITRKANLPSFTGIQCVLTRNVKITKFMFPVKPAMKSNDMWSVTRSSNMKSTEPEMLQSSKKQHIHGECPVKSVCSDKNCQDTHMQTVKPEKIN